jgi:hypothetical protein
MQHIAPLQDSIASLGLIHDPVFGHNQIVCAAVALDDLCDLMLPSLAKK